MYYLFSFFSYGIVFGAHLSVDRVPVVETAPDLVAAAVEVWLHEVRVVHDRAVASWFLQEPLADLRMKEVPG